MGKHVSSLSKPVLSTAEGGAESRRAWQTKSYIGRARPLDESMLLRLFQIGILSPGILGRKKAGADD